MGLRKAIDRQAVACNNVKLHIVQDNYPHKEIEAMLEKLQQLTGKWNLGYDGQKVMVNYQQSLHVFTSFVLAEAFVDTLIEKQNAENSK